MKISLIIPCIKRDSDVLLDVLRNFFENSTRLPCEIIVALSESSPVLAKELREAGEEMFGKIFLLVDTPHKALVGENRNRGFSVSSGDIIMFHDADDQIHPKKIEIMEYLFAKYPSVDMWNYPVQGDKYLWERYDNFENLVVIDPKEVQRVNYRPEMYERWSGCCDGHITCRRKVAEAIEFEEHLRYNQDRHFLQNALKKGFRGAVVIAYLAKYDLMTSIPPNALRHRKFISDTRPKRVRTKPCWRTMKAQLDQCAKNLAKFPNCFYVNLSRSTDRDRRFQNRAKEIGLGDKISRFEAVDGLSLHDISAEITDGWPLFQKNGKKISKGEIGCSLSHLKLIKQAFDSGMQEIVVFEDDVSFEFVSKWKCTFHDLLANAPADLVVLQLSTNVYEKTYLNAMNEAKRKKNQFIRSKIGFYGTYSYYINRKGMEKIVKKHWNEEKKRFLLAGSDFGQFYCADNIIFGIDGAYACTTPLFTFEIESSTLDHLSKNHAFSRNRIASFYHA